MSLVAILIAVDEVRRELPQIVCSDRLIAHHTQASGAGRPPIHHDESHVGPPNVKQNIVPDAQWRSRAWVRPSRARTRVIGTRQRQLPKKSSHRRFTVQAPCSGILNFGELPQEVRRDRQAA